MKNILMVIGVGVVLTACGSVSEVAVKQELMENRVSCQVSNQPDWYSEMPKEDTYLYATGSSEFTNDSIAEEKARVVAMVKLMRTVSETVEAMNTTSFSGSETNFGTHEENVFQNVTRTLANGTLSGVERVKFKQVACDERMKTYVLYRVSKKEAAKSAAQNLRKSLSDEDLELHNELLDNLDEELEARL